jgi:hypothetical protein
MCLRDKTAHKSSSLLAFAEQDSLPAVGWARKGRLDVEKTSVWAALFVYPPSVFRRKRALLQKILPDCGKVSGDKSIGRDSDG